MEYFESLKLKESWGKQSCDHPHFERQYYYGAFLITYVCTRCGHEFTIAQKMAMDKARKTGKKINVS